MNSNPEKAATYFEGRAKKAKTPEDRERFLAVARRYRKLANEKESAAPGRAADTMIDSRAHAVILFEVAARTNDPERKARVIALAETWLRFAAMNDALALWAEEAKGKMH